MDSSPSDDVLLLAVAERDIGAFRTLYERHVGWLSIRLVRVRRCNDRDLVADAVQDTFVAVWQKPGGYRGDGDIAAWLWGIAIRRLVSRLRRRTDISAVFEGNQTSPAAEDQTCSYGEARHRPTDRERAFQNEPSTAAGIWVLSRELFEQLTGHSGGLTSGDQPPDDHGGRWHADEDHQQVGQRDAGQ